MKIIQSFAFYEEGNSYLARRDETMSKNIENTYKNFYTFFLSYLTVKKNAGPVTMCCNKKAYDLFLKYIPYDNVEIIENTNAFNFWSIYKLDSMKQYYEDVIHVDPDVLIFDRLFDQFIENNKIDMMVQHRHSSEMNFMGDFVEDYHDFLLENEIYSPKLYDGRSQCTGVFGLRARIRDKYFKATDLLYREMREGRMSARKPHLNPVIIEEFTSYLISNKHKMRVHEILPYDLVKRYREHKVGDMVGYTHLWLGTRFDSRVIDLVKNQIKTEFPEHYHTVNKFEVEVFNKKMLV